MRCNHASIEQDLGCYVVDDLPCPTRSAPGCTTRPVPKTILLLESPHREEIGARHPLAGSAGKTVTKLLNCDPSIRRILDRISSGNEAIGRILQRHPRTLRLGLMNSSRLPLQTKAYCIGAYCSSQQHKRLYGELLCLLQSLRSRPKALSDDALPRASRVYRVLLNDLKWRLEMLPAGTLVIPCGNVARAFVDQARALEYKGLAEICAQQVSHPAARGKSSWSWESNETVRKLVDHVRQRAGLPS